jgi:diaminopimelate decarboxylase
MIRELESCGYTHFEGFHFHIGSQIFDLTAYELSIRKLAEFTEALEKEDGISVNAYNFGGGFAACYTEEDVPIRAEDACVSIIEICEEEQSLRGLSLKRIYIEPGRSIVAEAGCTLYRIGFQKESGGVNYAFVDGGMTDNIRPALYQARYRCHLANRMDEPPVMKVTIAGKCCESSDVLIKEAFLPKPEAGDLLVVHSTGAYGYSMASNYNRLGKPAVVFVKNGAARIVLRRETFEDMEKLEADLMI